MSTEADWSLTEYTDPESPQLWIFRKNLQPAVSPASRSHPYICYLTAHYVARDESGLPSSEDADRLAKIESDEIPLLELQNMAVLVGVALKDGIKDFVFYCSDKEEFIQGATRIRDAHPEFGFGLEISRDAKWEAYEDFP